MTALLVDDEEGILQILTKVLNRNGIQTIDAVATTQEGLELLTSKYYNLVFTDLNHNPSGSEVYKNATEKGSEAYIMSGYAPDIHQAQQVAEGHFLKKPFSISVIGKIAQDYLAQQNTHSQS